MAAAANHDEIELPVLDLSLLEKGADGVARLTEQLGAALEDVGFFFCTNHGVDRKLISGVFECAARLHALPMEEKTKVGLNENRLGYMPFGGSIRKGYSKPSGNAAFFLRFNANPPMPNQWPPVPGFEEVVTAYVEQVDDLAHRLMPLMARALKLPSPDSFFQEAFKGAEFSLRLSHYPDPAGRGVASADMGIAAHTDSGVLTLLGQQEKPGLELCLPDGRWVRPQSMPGTFLVHAGDMLRRWTNHKWLSALHRVVNVPGQDRYSCPVFWGPNPDVRISVLPTCTSPTNPPKYEPISYGEFRQAYYDGSYSGMRTLSAAQNRAAEEGLGNGQSSLVPGEDDGTLLFVRKDPPPPKSAL